MCPVNIRQIRAFQAVIETGSVTRAANHLHLTQPAVSKLIAAFEGQAGYRLFSRDRGRLIPSDEALFLAREVNDVLVSLDQLDQKVKEPGPVNTSLLKIASLPGATSFLIPQVLQKIGARRILPQVRITTLASSVHIRQLVASQQYDIAIMTEPPPSPDYDVVDVPQPMVCVMHNKDELANLPVVTPEDLADKPLVAVGRRYAPYDALVSAFSAYGKKYDPCFEVQTHLPAIGITAMGLAYGLVDTVNAWTLREFLRCGNLIIRPFEPRVVEPLAICSPSLRPLSDTARELHTRLVEQLKDSAKIGEVAS